MAEFYFTATHGQMAARIVVPTAAYATNLKAMFAARGVTTGATFPVGPSFERDLKESRLSLKLLGMISQI
jgi:hypothetical protein